MKLKDEIAFELILSIRKAGQEVVIPNFYFGRYEFDIFRILPNGNVYEYEIKTTRQDFKTDFKKSRIVGTGETKIETLKHEEIEFGNYPANKFFFVVPEGVLKATEIPKGLGLIYYSKTEFGAKFELMQAPKFINKNKIEINHEEISKRLAYRELNLRLKNYELTKKIRKL